MDLATACTTTLISTIPSVAYYSYNTIRGTKEKEQPPPELDVDKICVLRYKNSSSQSKKKKIPYYFVVGVEELKECKYNHLEEAYNKIISTGYGRLKGELEIRWKKILDHDGRDEQKAIMVFYKLEEDAPKKGWNKSSDKKKENVAVEESSPEQELPKVDKGGETNARPCSTKKRWRTRREVEGPPLSFAQEQELKREDPPKVGTAAETKKWSDDAEKNRVDTRRHLWRPRRDEEQTKPSCSSTTTESNHEDPKPNVHSECCYLDCKNEPNQKEAESELFWSFGKAVQLPPDKAVSAKSPFQIEEEYVDKRVPSKEYSFADHNKKDRLGLLRRKTDKSNRKAKIKANTCGQPVPQQPAEDMELPSGQQMKQEQDFQSFGASTIRDETTEGQVPFVDEPGGGKGPSWTFGIDMEGLLRFGKPVEGNPDNSSQPKDDSEPVFLAPIEEVAATEGFTRKNRRRAFRKDDSVIRNERFKKLRKKKLKGIDGEKPNLETGDEGLEKAVVTVEAATTTSEARNQNSKSEVPTKEHLVTETFQAWPFVIDVEGFWNFGKASAVKLEEKIKEDNMSRDNGKPEDDVTVLPGTKENDQKQSRLRVFLRDPKVKNDVTCEKSEQQQGGGGKLENGEENKEMCAATNVHVQPGQGLWGSVASDKSGGLGVGIDKSDRQSQEGHKLKTRRSKRLLRRKVEGSATPNSRQEEAEDCDVASRKGDSAALRAASTEGSVGKKNVVMAETTPDPGAKTRSFWGLHL